MINRGPETRRTGDLTFEYDRGKRRGTGWWASRHADDLKRKNRLSRILLLDLAVLLVLMGFLYPFLRDLNRRVRVDGYRARAHLEVGETAGLVQVDIRLIPRSEGGEGTYVLILRDADGTERSREADILPGPGETRRSVLRFASGDVPGPLELVLQIDDEEGVLVVGNRDFY